MRRTIFALLCSLIPLVALMPGSVSAHGPLLLGREIDRSTAVSGSTGTCDCDWTWYTLGLRPGTVTVSAAVHSFTAQGGPSYGIRAVLMQNGRDLTGSGVSCSSSQWQCNKSLHFSYRIRGAGVYYLAVKGVGGSGITYTMWVRGTIYPLHCSRYC